MGPEKNYIILMYGKYEHSHTLVPYNSAMRENGCAIAGCGIGGVNGSELPAEN